MTSTFSSFARHLTTASIFVFAALAAHPSVAQTPPASPAQDGNTAVKLAKEGKAAFDAGRWDEAHDLFAKAHAAASSPVFQLFMARSRRNAKKLVQAKEAYLRVTRAEIPADAPASWQQALTDARTELAVLLGQVPSIVVDVAGSPPGTTVRVDARPVRPGETVDVDPGEHVIVATHDGQNVERRVTVETGQRGVRVTIGEASGQPSSSPSAPAEPRGTSSGSVVPGIVGLAVGGAGLGMGALFGALALGADGDVTTTCPNDRCADDATLAAARDDQSTSQGLADASTVLFIVGGAAAAAGVVLLVVRPGGGDSRADVALKVRPGGASLSGAF